MNPRQRKLTRKNALWTERSSWDSHWREISKYQQPRLGRFFTTDRNQGQRRNQHIVDNTALFGSRTLAAGMMSGMTSPARPWFKMALADSDLMEFGPVKTWLHRVNSLMLAVFASSNTYRALHSCYEELGLFGTWADFVMDDFDNVVHHYPMTIGEYAIATDEKGNVDTLCRGFQMTVAQIVKKFGKENCSHTVQNMFTSNKLDAWVDVVHMVEPRTERDPGRADSRNMPFSSCYMEPGSDSWDQFLRESGFDRFPALCPRWAVTGNDIYGQSPGMDVLGDVKQLQQEQLRKGQAIDYKVNPPLQVPSQYKGAATDRLPGGIFFVDSMGASAGVRSAYEVNLDLSHLLEDINDVRGRIREGYYADLFLMLANDTRSGTTATEIAERHEEKLLMLGPVLERLHNELLSPLVDMTFERISRAGLLTGPREPPPELQGMALKIEFVSVLAQAQRAVAAGGVDRLLGTVSSIAAVKPEVLDKIDFDQVVDDYAEMFGVNPEIVIPDERVAEIRAQRAQQMAAQQAAAAAPSMVDAAQTASEIDVDNMRNVMEGLQGYGTAPAM
ncbi:MAG: phage head-tail adapter protein [Hydrogenophaga sp.]|nr:phage head-tail adapter protein [Hydrogenophaga sp.]